MCLAVIEGGTLDSLEIEFPGRMEWRTKSPISNEITDSYSFMN